MTTPEAADDGQTPPPTGGREPLFRVMYDAGLQSVGEPMRMGTGRLRIEIAPVQLVRLLQELSSRAVIALMLVLDECYRPGKRIEVEGWSARWLIERGMARTTAEKAARELTEKGYIRSERFPGSTSPLGKKLGVVPGGLVEDVEDLPGIPRTDGRPPARLKGVAGGTQGAGPAEDRNEPVNVERVVENPVSEVHRNGGSPDRREGNPEDVFPQVSAVAAVGRNGLSTAPSSSGRSEEGLFFSLGQGGTLTRPDLTRFFAQAVLVEAVASKWEVVVALVAREFASNATRCAELVGWLGDGEDAQPETRLAQIVVDLIKTYPVDRFAVAASQEAFLRSRGVKFRQTTPDDFLAAFVVTIVAALDSARPIDSWGGWFGAGLKRNEQFQGKVLAATLAVFRRLLESPDDLLPSPGTQPANTAGETTYTAEDPSYAERLRAAAQGTIWEDPISFEKLLHNPGQQARVLMAHERRSRG